MLKSAAYIFLGMLLSLQASSQSFSEIDQLFSEWGEENHPGGAIAIVDNGEMVYSNGFGLANIEFKAPIDKSTIFNIASVSKQITAFSMILLAQEGLISLDDEVRLYIPELPDFGEKITIKHLVFHISGLRNFQNLLTMAGWREGDPMSNDDLLKYIKWQQDLNFPVGSEYLYCNTGYNLMATIVERITGQSFIQWTKENIFGPLGMDNTEYRNDMTRIQPNTAISYDGIAETGFTRPLAFWNYMGNGNVYTTVGDLAKWMINFSTHQLGGLEGFNQLKEKGVLTDGKEINYAFGISHGNYRGISTLQHGGSIGGYRSTLMYFPDQKVGIVVLTNFSSANPGRKTREVADMYLKEHFTKETDPPAVQATFSRDVVSISTAQRVEREGNFLLNGLVVDFYSEKDQLMGKAQGFPPVPVSATSDSTAYIAPLNMDVWFRRNHRDSITSIVLYDPNPQYGVKIDRSFINSPAMSDLIGTYFSPELKTEYTISMTETGLTVSHARHETFDITPLNKNELVGGAWFFNEVRVVRNSIGKVTGLKVSNGRVRDLVFLKQGF